MIESNINLLYSNKFTRKLKLPNIKKPGQTNKTKKYKKYKT